MLQDIAVLTGGTMISEEVGLSLAGTVCADGAHLHAAVADGSGAVSGGHVCAGCIVATTAEIALLPLRETRLGRQEDPATGHLELTVRPAGY